MNKILVIEDEQIIRDLICELLEFEDYEVVKAENGLVGLDIADSTVPDLILCDIMMPELDGYGVLRELQHNPTTETIPFIFLTAKGTKTNVREGMELGADDYLTKPFTKAELMGAIAIRLHKKEGFQRSSEQRLKQLRNNLSRSLPHELLTPLNNILGFTQLLEMEHDSLSADEINQISKQIKTAAKRLHQLIRNFLLYAQLELASEDQTKLNNLLAGSTIDSKESLTVVAREKAQAYDRLADLKLELEEVTVAVAENWFWKIAEELIDNAFKFSELDTLVEVSSRSNDNNWILSVKDVGRGMTEEQITQIGAYMQFERKIYEQQGSGLGLAITKRLVELYRGKLTIESFLEKGTTVEIILPLIAVYS